MGSRARVRRGWEVRDRERRSGMARWVRIWRVISGGRDASCTMVVELEVEYCEA